MTSASSLGGTDSAFKVPLRVIDHTQSANIADSVSEALINTPHRGSDSSINPRSRSEASCVERGPSASSRSSITTTRGEPANARASPTSTRCQFDSSPQRRPMHSRAPTRSSACAATRSASRRPCPCNANGQPTNRDTSTPNSGPSRSTHTISCPNNRVRERSRKPPHTPPHHRPPPPPRPPHPPRTLQQRRLPLKPQPHHRHDLPRTNQKR